MFCGRLEGRDGVVANLTNALVPLDSPVVSKFLKVGSNRASGKYCGDVEYREYQWEAVEKLGGLPYCLIADDMGTGKTVTGIGVALESLTGGPYLVATPSLAVWRKHLLLMGVDRSLIHCGKDKDFFEQLEFPTEDSWYVINWEWLWSKPEIHKWRYGTVIADEVHKAKNRKSRRTKGLKMLRCGTKIGLTGTPAHDKPEDIWSILNWFDKNEWSSFWSFVDDYIEWSMHYNGYREFFGVKNEHQFQEMLEPFYVSRTIPLPEVKHVTVKVCLDEDHRREYDRMAKESIALLDDSFALIAGSDLVVSTRLHQMASAGLVHDGVKMMKREDFDGNDEWVPVDQFKMVEPFPKLSGVVQVCEAQGADGTVVYCSRVDTIEALCRRLDAAGLSYTVADASHKNIDEAAEAFQSGRADVFISTTKYATEAIELVRTNVLVFADFKPWEHADEAQIIGRIRRMSQLAERVWVIEFLTENTVDYERLEKIDAKRQKVVQLMGPKMLVTDD
jgi:hypothetical protein